MLINKMTLRELYVSEIRKYVALFLAGFIVFLFAVSLDVHAAAKVKADGILTSIESDGTVIINGMGYLVSPSVTIQDYRGTPISLRDIHLPQNVHFEYEYSPQGFMIIFIKENAV